MRTALILLSALALAACETPASDVSTVPAVTDGPITTEAQFRSTIVGKDIFFGPENQFRINADGTLIGSFNGNALAGTWTWEDQYWCRTLSNVETAAKEDCQTWEVTGDGVRATRERGAGRGFDYTIGSA